jgi:hypothetical protein
MTEYPDDFWDLNEVEKGTLLADWYEDGIRFVVLAHFGFCAYLGVPVDHPLAGFGYDEMPLDCHGGLTFAYEGDGENRPKFFYFYGWDYSHAGDKTFSRTGLIESPYKGDREWTLGEIKAEMKSASYDFKRLMKLAEVIKEAQK